MIARDTPIGAPVLADVDTYPTGYAQGEPRSRVKARGTIHAIEGDAGIDWCFVRLDDPGGGPEYMHVPLDRVDLVPTYIIGYAEGGVRRSPASPKQHAVKPDTSKRASFGYRAVSMCGITVRHGSGASTFDVDNTGSCSRCTHSIERAKPS